MSSFEIKFFEYLNTLKSYWKTMPLNLGGTGGDGGGTGGPPGGFVGQLPQTRVCYDVTESATNLTTSSGRSLLDNLNHIRYRLRALETGSGISVSGGGHTIAYNDVVMPQRTTLNFTGTGVTVIDDSINNSTDINIIAGSGGGGGTPGGSDTQVQFNDGGSFGGDSGFIYNKNTDTATLAGELHISGLTGNILSSTAVKSGIMELDQSQYYEYNTGFVTFNYPGTYYTITGGALRLDIPGYGYIKGKKVSWSAPQTTSVFSANTCNYVYINSNGTIGSTSTLSDSLYQDYIVLFEVLYDGTNYIAVKENHQYSSNALSRRNLHREVGPVIRNDNRGAIVEKLGTGYGSNANDRRIKITGTDYLDDEDLTTVVSDSGGSAVTLNNYYRSMTDGKWYLYSQDTELPMRYSGAGGTADAITLNRFATFRIYVAKDNLNSSSPIYFSVMGEGDYASDSLARTAIINGTVRATNELAGLELVQLAIVIVKYNTYGGYIYEVIVDKDVSKGKPTGTGATTQALLVSTNTTYFNGILSGSNTSVQDALDTIDNYVPRVNYSSTFPSSPTEGELFIHTPTGRAILYVYKGSAWNAIQSLGTMTMYVDGTNGTDSVSHGTASGTSAFATLQYAINMIPPVVNGNVVIYVLNQTAEDVVIMGKTFGGNYSIDIYGALTTGTAVTDSGAGVQGAGSTRATVVRSSGTWTTNQIQHQLLRGTSGGNNGVYRLVDSNTTTTATLVGTWIADPAAGESFCPYYWGGTALNSITVTNGQKGVNIYDINIGTLTSSNGSVCSATRCSIVYTLSTVQSLIDLDTCFCNRTTGTVIIASTSSRVKTDRCKVLGVSGTTIGMESAYSSILLVRYGTVIASHIYGARATTNGVIECINTASENYLFISSYSSYGITSTTGGQVLGTSNNQYGGGGSGTELPVAASYGYID
jgi:hypothetical protein